MKKELHKVRLRISSIGNFRKLNMSDKANGDCSDLRAVCNVILSAIGIGILSLPMSFASGGWIGGIFTMLIGVLVPNTAVLKLFYSIRNQDSKSIVNSYEALGTEIGGRKLGIFTACVVHITITGCCSALLLMIGKCISDLVPALTPRWSTIASGVFLVPCCWLRSLHEVGYISAIGTLSILALLVVIVIAGLTSTSFTSPSRAVIIYDFHAFSLSLCVAVFSFNIANTVPTLVHDMRNPQRFPKVAIAGAFSIFFINLSICAAAYLGWGDLLSTRDTIMDFLFESAVPGLGKTAVVFILLMAIPHYIVLFIPVANAAELILPAFQLRLILTRTILVGVTVLVAITVPDIKTIINVLGAFTMSFIALILPVLFYVTTRWRQGLHLEIADRVTCGFILIIAMFLLTFGGYTAVAKAISDAARI